MRTKRVHADSHVTPGCFTRRTMMCGRDIADAEFGTTFVTERDAERVNCASCKRAIANCPHSAGWRRALKAAAEKFTEAVSGIPCR